MSRLIEILPNLFRINLYNATRSNAYIVHERDGDTLVDPGPVGTASAILALDRRRIVRLRRIALTHAHPAHAGSVARIARGTGVDVFVHEADAPFLDGRSPPLLPQGRRGQLIAALGRLVDLCPPVFRLDVLADGVEIGSLRTIHLPGHTPGHSAFLHRPSGALICGDAIVTQEDGSWGLLPESYSHAPATARASLERLTGFEFSHLLPGHGPVRISDGIGRLRAFLSLTSAAATDSLPGDVRRAG
jgi:glyoxylase-like metal-dependent hydrolase (beta-lactamase superfamily II)